MRTEVVVLLLAAAVQRRAAGVEVLDEQHDVGDGQAGHEVDNEPGLEVALSNGAVVGDDVAVAVEICRPKVDEEVEQKIEI